MNPTSPEAAVLATLTPTPAASRTAPPPETATLPAGLEPLLFLTLTRRSLSGLEPDGVQTLDLLHGDVESIVPAGHRLLDSSPNGRRILVSDGPELYTLEPLTGDRHVVTGRYFAGSPRGAEWLSDTSQLVFIEQSPEGDRGLFIWSAGAGDPRRLAGLEAEPVQVYPSAARTGVFWESGVCTPDGECTLRGVWRTTVDGISSEPWPDILHPMTSPDGAWLAYVHTIGEDDYALELSTGDGGQTRTLELPVDHLVDYRWSPDSASLAVIGLIRSDYSGRRMAAHHYLVEAASGSVRELPEELGLREGLLWTFDGTRLLYFGTQQAEAGYRVELALLDLETGAVQVFDPGPTFSSPEFVFVAAAVWAYGAP